MWCLSIPVWADHETVPHMTDCAGDGLFLQHQVEVWVGYLYRPVIVAGDQPGHCRLLLVLQRRMTVAAHEQIPILLPLRLKLGIGQRLRMD